MSCYKAAVFYPLILVLHVTSGFILPTRSSFYTQQQQQRTHQWSSSSFQSSSKLDNSDDIRSQVDTLLSILSPPDDTFTPSSSSQVYIIGTGLSNRVSDLPLSTLSILVRADVVLHDSLSIPHDEIRRVVPEHCIIQNVGKRGDDQSSFKQIDIDQLLLHYSTQNNNKHSNNNIVVRLKGGDPFLFGRSRSEIDALREHSVQYTVIPNLSSCVAGPHYGGIPLTDPLLDAQSFAVFSGTNAKGKGFNSDEDGVSIDWDGMNVDTLVFLMIGRLDKLDALCHKIVTDGGKRWGVDMTCAIVQSAGRSNQKVWRGTLGTLVSVIKNDIGDDGVTSVSPAIFVVGRTASLDLLS